MQRKEKFRGLRAASTVRSCSETVSKKGEPEGSSYEKVYGLRRWKNKIGLAEAKSEMLWLQNGKKKRRPCAKGYF